MPTKTNGKPMMPARDGQETSKILMALLAGAAIGAVIGYAYAPKAPRAATYDEGRVDAQREYDGRLAQMADLGLLRPAVPTMEVSGTIKAIDGNRVTIETPQLVLDPREEAAPTTRVVLLSASTKLLKLEPKDQAALLADQKRADEERAAYERALEAGDEEMPPPPTPASPFEEKQIEAKDLAVGMHVSVRAVNDILRAATIDATELRVTEAPRAPEPPAPAEPPAE